MKPKTKQKKLRITEAELSPSGFSSFSPRKSKQASLHSVRRRFMLANRRAARLEEIAEHGRPVSFRKAVHKSKKVYDRKRLKRMEQKLSDKSE